MDDLKAIARRAMFDNGLQPDFPDAAIRQANSIAAAAISRDPQLRDLRALPWSSIDNDDSRDLDQLEVAQPGADGATRILVAIADVEELVKRDSPIDQHASANTTSVYTAAQTFPMLPERLSTDLSSLGAGEERLALVMDMTVTPAGELAAEAVYRARVFNRAKLAYDSVAAWLDGKSPAPGPVAAVNGMDEQLRLQDRVAQQLRRSRQAQGALCFDTVEARPVFDEQTLTDLRIDQRNRAKDLIEDFMVAANGVVARFMAGKGRMSLRRVLRVPERWDRIVAVAARAGGRLPAAPDARALNQFLMQRREADPDTYPDLSLSVIKLLGAGEYAVDLPGQAAPGHFGLAVRDYMHSTAPNRRYPDLIGQRLLKAALADQPAPYTAEALRALATHCTEQEKNGAKVERVVRKAASAILLAPHIGEQFSGIVTGASEKGTWVRLDHPVAEGRIMKGYEGLDVGDRVRVQLLEVNPDRGFIDFRRV
ncbi:MAG TPA: RNB domain-containing ribonuclease [Steroidobacteraceae bacterium]|nr:RNB domain-containing ribonuclease [Steroidobacteraceae bacterium]